MASSSSSNPDALLAEHVAYYRARAPEYSQTAIPEFPTGELGTARDAVISALSDFRPRGNVLELACGPGTCMSRLPRLAYTVTAVDAAPEMLPIAAKVRNRRVRFVQADLFGWKPDRCYDVVFFGSWLSPVPLERFEELWELIDRCLAWDGTSQSDISWGRSSGAPAVGPVTAASLPDGRPPGFRPKRMPQPCLGWASRGFLSRCT